MAKEDGHDRGRREPNPAGGAPLVQLDAPPSARDIRDASLIKEGDVFLLTDHEGNAPLGNANGFGLYFRDTRFLSGYELVIEGLRPTVLLSSSRSQFLSAQVLTNPNLALPDGRRVDEQTIQIRRYRVIRGAEVTESVTFQNFNPFPVQLGIAMRLQARFDDAFEVRGIVGADGRGALHPLEYEDGRVSFRYDGRDGVRRTTELRFDPAPTAVQHLAEGGVASYALELPAGGSQRVGITIRIEEHELRADPLHGGGAASPATTSRAREASLVGYRQFLAEQAGIQTSNELFNQMILQARLDLRVLLGGTRDEPFVCAGIPWYATLFGRDALITALLDLWISPSLARHTLRLLARWQGTRDDPTRDEEPGKIMHELRRGELARAGLIPFTPYFGTIDATPLWILLLAEYHRATADVELVRELRPNLDAALTWMDAHGDLDRDGLLEYRCRTTSGLVNQGWKDSWDGIVHADGTLAEAPIALVEVQGYAYAALVGAARLFRVLGEPSRAAELDRRAAELFDAFDRAFWLRDECFYAIALDGHKQRVSSITSNPGHALWSGIVPFDRREKVARRLFDEDLFTGYGIRTLSMRERRYNPAGYHVGTVWPHDNALIALGLKRAGQEARLLELFSGLYDAAQHFPSLRLPELFCGFARTAFGVPVRYPVACSPQVWAAASWSAFLQATLGILACAPARELRIASPQLPLWLSWVEVQRLPVGSAEVDLRYERIGDHTAVDVRGMRGDVRVALVSRWDPEG